MADEVTVETVVACPGYRSVGEECNRQPWTPENYGMCTFEMLCSDLEQSLLIWLRCTEVARSLERTMYNSARIIAQGV